MALIGSLVRNISFLSKYFQFFSRAKYFFDANISFFLRNIFTSIEMLVCTINGPNRLSREKCVSFLQRLLHLSLHLYQTTHSFLWISFWIHFFLKMRMHQAATFITSPLSNYTLLFANFLLNIVFTFKTSKTNKNASSCYIYHFTFIKLHTPFCKFYFEYFLHF